jgi:hypothetical protein
MASLSNINGLFDVHSTGAILFSTSHGTSGQILRSNGDAAPTWIDFSSTGFGGDYLLLTGGVLTGNLTINGTNNLTVGGTVGITGLLTGTTGSFSGLVSGITPTAAANFATKDYVDNNAGTTYTAGNGITLTGTPATVINADINYISYSGSNNFIVYGAQDGLGTTIPTGSIISYVPSGGTQIVTKAYVSDLPFTNNAGDITGVTAGTDLSGGGTSGSVTLNNTSTLATVTGRGASTGTSTTFGSTGVNTKLRVVDTTYYTSPTYSWTNSAIQTTSIEIIDATTDNANVCATLVMHNYGDGGVKFRMGNTGDKTLYLSSGQSAGAGNPTDDNSGTYFDEMKINNAVVYHTGNLPSGSGVTSVATGNGLTGGTITSTGTLTMSGSYTGTFTTTAVATDSIVTSAGSLVINDPLDQNSNLVIAGRYDLGSTTLSFRSGHGGNANVWDMADILVEDDTNYNGRILFRTSPLGYGNTPTTKMTIRSSGAIAFGTSITNYGGSGQVLTSAGNTTPTWTTPSTGTVTSVATGNGLTGGTITSTGTLTMSGSYTGTLTATTFSGPLSGNASTATTFNTGRTNYKGVTDAAVIGQMMWKNYGNNHTIFDASASTSPSGSSVNNTNSGTAWSSSYPTLMGWNGANTYGVRVDSARIADSATVAGNYLPLAGGTMTGTITSTATVGFEIDSNSWAHIALDSNANWSYIRYANNTSVSWDTGVYNGGDYQLRPAGSGTNAWLYSSAGYSTAPVSSRSPLFYDSNNTGYYGDFAGQSTFSRLKLLGTGLNAAATLEIDNPSTSTYMHSAEVFTANMTTGQTNVFFVGKVGSTKNAGYLGFNYSGTLGSNNNYVSMGLWGANNLFRVYGDQILGTVTQRNEVDLRAPIFYDYNNTGYYADLAGQSILYNLELIGAKHTYLTINPGNPYEAMVRYTGGSGTHWYVGKRNGTSNGITSADFHWYSALAGVTVGGITTAGVMQVTGSSRAPLFYDSNNTVFYVDPAANSIISSFSAYSNSIFSGNSHLTFGPNSTWGSSIRFGGNGHTATGTEMASVVTTDGNIHLDAANSSNGIYLNYYAGTGGTFFGTGAGGYVARVYSTGNAHFPIYYDYSNTAFYLDPASTGTSLNVAGDVVGYSSSDIRYKDNVKPIENALDKIDKIKGYTFEWNELSHKQTGKKDIGVIAQKEQQIIINDLKSRIEKLEL